MANRKICKAKSPAHVRQQKQLQQTRSSRLTDADKTSKTLTIAVGAVTKPKGVTVGGKVKSYGSASETVTVTLLQGTSVIGSPQCSPESPALRLTPSLLLDTVPAGTYTLKVEKKGHAPWTENITIGIDSITSKNVTVYLWGDVNRDGVVTAADAQEIAAQRSKAFLCIRYGVEQILLDTPCGCE